MTLNPSLASETLQIRAVPPKGIAGWGSLSVHTCVAVEAELEFVHASLWALG